MDHYRTYSAADLLRSPELLPCAAGVYFILLDKHDALDHALANQAADPEKIWRGLRRLLYVGSSERGLRGRLQDHLAGDCRVSSFRFTLGLLLAEDLRLEAARRPDRGGLTFGPEGERRLTRWISEHTSVAFRCCASPEAVERVLIGRGRPLLNLEHQVRTAWTRELFRRRRVARRAVGRRSESSPATQKLVVVE